MQVEKPSDITAADKLIFPGVGSFGQAIEVLQKRDYTKPLIEYIEVGTAPSQRYSFHEFSSTAAAATAAAVLGCQQSSLDCAAQQLAACLDCKEEGQRASCAQGTEAVLHEYASMFRRQSLPASQQGCQRA
jgi:hypothetical protein